MIVLLQIRLSKMRLLVDIQLAGCVCVSSNGPTCNKTPKDQLGLSKCRALLEAFTKYLILVEAYLRIQRVITYPYILR